MNRQGLRAINPTPKQEIAWDYLWDNETTQLLFGGGVNSGKTWWACEVALVYCICFGHIRVCVGRKQLKKIRESWLVTWYKVLRHHGLEPKQIFKFNGQDNCLLFPNGSRIDLVDLEYEPSDPEWQRLGSIEYTFAIIEEAGEVEYKAFQTLLTRVGRCENNRHGIKPMIIMTCNPSKNWLYTEFYRPWAAGTLPKHMKFVPALITDNVHADPASFEAMNFMTDSNMRRRLYEGDWEYSTDETALIEHGALPDLFSANTSANVRPGTRYLTCDIARYGKDSTVVIQWEGFRAERIHVWEKFGVVESAKKIRALAMDFGCPVSRIAVDADGVGGGVADHLYGCEQFINNATPISLRGKKENFTNLKSQCYYKLAELINNRQIFIKADNISQQNKICEELEQVKMSDPDSDGKLAVMSKRDVKKNLGRSPDIADALMMRALFEIKKNSYRTISIA